MPGKEPPQPYRGLDLVLVRVLVVVEVRAVVRRHDDVMPG